MDRASPTLLMGLSPRGRGNQAGGVHRALFQGSIPAWAGEPWNCPIRGLSPRGRGNRLLLRLEKEGTRSIPAWAGDKISGGKEAVDTVYPRVGGGTALVAAGILIYKGLSPRGRGNHGYTDFRNARVRSIPAWAGEPCRIPSARALHRVYPRVGGGTGVHRRGRKPRHGLSPRGRGNRERSHLRSQLNRSIPAWAGEPTTTARSRPASKVYPRVGGGTDPGSAPGSAQVGLSPRGRGNPSTLQGVGSPLRSIPAWAGEPAAQRRWSLEGSIPAWAGEPSIHWCGVNPMPVYPRVGGGTSNGFKDAVNVRGLSPRGRGNRAAHVRRHRDGGSIPAWAGEPPRTPSERSAARVYPRVGGGTLDDGDCIYFADGLSPRGRGNHEKGASELRPSGSIPAWAGEPQ